MVADNLSYTEIKVSKQISSILAWNKNSNYTAELKIGDQIPIPESAYNNFTISLKWQTVSSDVNIGSSIIMLDENKNF